MTDYGVDEINDMKKSVEGLVYVPVLSREDWDGATGYVHKHYKKIISDESLKDPIFYLCGWRDMILESRNNLKDLGYDTKKIICDMFFIYEFYLEYHNKLESYQIRSIIF